jgi:hypothetical protein
MAGIWGKVVGMGFLPEPDWEMLFIAIRLCMRLVQKRVRVAV